LRVSSAIIFTIPDDPSFQPLAAKSESRGCASRAAATGGLRGASPAAEHRDRRQH
jgi:hypothetical protein